MASAQVVETSVNTNKSPSQDYTKNPDDHSNHKIARVLKKNTLLNSQSEASIFCRCGISEKIAQCNRASTPDLGNLQR